MFRNNNPMHSLSIVLVSTTVGYFPYGCKFSQMASQLGKMCSRMLYDIRLWITIMTLAEQGHKRNISLQLTSWIQCSSLLISKTLTTTEAAILRL